MLSYLEIYVYDYWIQGQRKGNILKRLTMSEIIIIIFQGFSSGKKYVAFMCDKGFPPFGLFSRACKKFNIDAIVI